MSAEPPLTEVTVLDVSRTLTAPYCSALLADLGAIIIKVEIATGGDVTRLFPPFKGQHSFNVKSISREQCPSVGALLSFCSSEACAAHLKCRLQGALTSPTHPLKLALAAGQPLERA
ncbi:CoA transferase [Arthrobacter sp. MDT1-48-3]